MNRISHKNVEKQDFMPLMQALVRAYQAFTRYDAKGLRRVGLTIPQADVIFTLGNTKGLSFKDIGEQTLITKGTLTGVVDRLAGKGLVKRTQQADDKRCMSVRLTAKGEQVFERVFPAHIAYLGSGFGQLGVPEMAQGTQFLKKLAEVF